MVKAGLSFCDPEGCGTLPTVLARAALRILSRKLKFSVKTFATPRINPFTRQPPNDAVPVHFRHRLPCEPWVTKRKTVESVALRTDKKGEIN
jgi:hypothetical protein